MWQKYVSWAIVGVIWGGSLPAGAQPLPSPGEPALAQVYARELARRDSLMAAIWAQVRGLNAQALRDTILRRHPLGSPALPRFPTPPNGALSQPTRLAPDWREEIKRRRKE
jgi:hypothetical protein